MNYQIKTYRWPRLTLLLLAGSVLSVVRAQEPAPSWYPSPQEEVVRRDFDEETWQRLTRDLDYSQDRRQKKKEQDSERLSGKGGGPLRDFFSRGFSGETGDAIMKGFIILVALILLVILLRALIRWRQRPHDKQIRHGAVSIDLEKIEANIHESDLDTFIRQAREQQDYTLAIRLYYLAVLKALSNGQFIRWKKDKTNQDYRTELLRHPYEPEFSALTGIFERAWYGQQSLSASRYRELEPRFQRFISQVSAESGEHQNESTGPSAAEPS